MADTVQTIIEDQIRDVMLQSSSSDIDDIHKEAGIRYYNHCGRIIWNKWPWANRELDLFEVTPDSDGIITFDGDNSTVDMVKAIVPVNADFENNVGYALEPAARVGEMMKAAEVSGSSFIRLADDSSGNRRIQVNADDDASTYKVLATKRFVKATSDNYDTVTWPLDKAQPALEEFIREKVRVFEGIESRESWDRTLETIINDIRATEARDEQIMVPHAPGYSDNLYSL